MRAKNIHTPIRQDILRGALGVFVCTFCWHAVEDGEKRCLGDQLSQIYFTWTKKCSASRCGPSNRAEVLPILKKKDVQPTKPFLLLPPDDKHLQMSSIQLALVGQCGCRVSAQCVPDCSRAKDCSTYYLLNMFSSLIRLTLRDYGSVLATVMARMELQTLARDFH